MRKMVCMGSLIALLLLAGCATKPKFLDPGWTPGRIAVLPFTNESVDVSVEKFARALMYRTLRNKKYDLVDLNEIDMRLNELGITEGGQLPTVTIVELREKIDADAFLYGDIIEAKRVLLGIYFEKKFKAAFRIVDAYSGNTVWEDERESSESRLVFNPDTVIETAADEVADDLVMKSLDSHPLIKHMEKVVQTSVRSIPKP
ncbi:MAG: DUF799 family lipoprotein [Spirochaetales bacterium]|nr:DUF799 family lipoprotein [Spirochaetales bacterium]